MRDGDLGAGLGEGGIDAALKAVARIGIDAELAAGRRGAQRIEIGGFEEHIDGLVGEQPACSPPMMPPIASGPASSAITVMRRIEPIGLAVERQHLLAVACKSRADIALHLVGVEDMQAAAHRRR